MKKYFGIFLMISMATIFIFSTSCKKKNEVVHPYTIGQHYGGGIIFYIDASWLHGLICTTSDQGTTLWGCDAIIGGTSTAIGTGQANTTAILNKCSTSSLAASICDQYSVKVGDVTYDDWFLPSIDELNQIFRQNILIPGSYNAGYWSSTEYDDFAMRSTNTGNDQTLLSSKDYGICKVRAVRAF
jgi:hypothetical protein